MHVIKPGLLTAGIAACLALPFGVSTTPQLPKTKIALIVAIGTYADGGWNNLATANDEKAIRSALKRQGFLDADIRTLADQEANAPAIVSAFRESLIKRAQASKTPTVAVFHFSGHGHRITDDNGDEPDGYDEVLVPFDAPHDPPATYTGEKHIRDDQLNELIRALRVAVGPQGDVVVSLDSCYSGSGARSDMATAQARGEIKPIGPPQGGRQGVDLASGFDEPPGALAATAAPYVVLSAAGHAERAWETSNTDHTAIGSLSLALSRALQAAGTETTYRALFDDVKRRMAAVVVNTPQIEGTQDREIFGGAAITQQPFYTILAFDPPTGRARLEHGTLAGLFTGTRVAVHPAGTAIPRPENAIATGTVTASPTESIVDLENIVDPSKVAAGWMFVTEQTFGSLRAVVKIDGVPNAAWVAPLTKALTAQPFVSVGAASPDFLVTQDPKSPSQVFLREASDARVLLGPLDPADGALPDSIASRVKYAMHNRYLRSLSMTSPGINASIEMMPCELACTKTPFGQKCDCVKDLDRQLFQPPGGDLTLALGDGFRFRLRNLGTQSVFVSVLDLLPNGDLTLLWPDVKHNGDDNKLLPGADFVIPQPWRAAPPTGVEVFKLVASLGQVDFRPIVSNGFRSQNARGPLDNLFVDAFEGARAEATLPVSSVHTQGITVRVVEKRTP
ncbi:MAG TPA: caspase family protein [Vicinamibacterales bacterium]